MRGFFLIPAACQLVSLLEMQTVQNQQETQATYLKAHNATLKLPERYQYA